jgi:hypothetical protein
MQQNMSFKRQKIQCEVSHRNAKTATTYISWGIYSCDRTKEQLYHFFIIDKAEDLDEQSPVFKVQSALIENKL